MLRVLFRILNIEILKRADHVFRILNILFNGTDFADQKKRTKKIPLG